MSKLLKVIVNTLLLLAILSAGALVIPPFAGITTLVSDGMGNTNISRGAVTYAKKTDTSSVATGDKILVDDNSGKYIYTIQSLDTAAGTASVKNVISGDTTEITVRATVSKVIVTIPVIGFLSMAAQSREGIMIIGLAILFLVILFILSEVWKRDEEEDEEEEEEDEDEDDETGHFVCRRMLILKTFLVILLWSTCLVSGYRGHAQERTTVTVNMTDVTLNEVITELKKQTKYDFFYNSELVKSKGRVSVRARNLDLREVLEQVLTPVGLEYAIQQDLITIRERRVQQEVAKIEMITVSGKVTDKDGNPVVGATVVIHGTTQGVATDVDGKYSLMTRPDDVLTISFIGYKTEVVPVKENKHLNVILSPASEDLEEVTVVAFGQQKKESVVSAITTVRPMDLKSSNSDLTSSFAGKIAGMVGWQTGGLPAALTEEEMNTKFYIRGITSFQTGANVDPLILLDGVESSKLDLARIAPEDIETFSVMKDASATAMYGARGANGVILVTTKKGQEGSVYATARYESVFSMPTKRIDVVDPVDYMKMYNRALLTRDPLATPKYSVERINRTRSGKYPSWVYPANDWYKILFKNYNVNHHAGLNIRGGSKVIQYYASVNYNRDQGMLKTDKLNDFDCNITNNQTAFRVNLTIDLKAGIKLLINSSTTIDKYHGPLTSVNQAYELAFNASPVDFAPLYPGDENYGWPHLRFGTTEANQENPYMMIQKGYLERTRYSTTNRAEYIHNLSGLVKGLELRGSVAVSQAGYYTTGFTTNPFKYSLLNYDFETGKHRLQDLSPFGAS